MTVDTTTRPHSAIEGLKERLGDLILVDEAERSRYVTDWGDWIHRTPGAVARPRSTEDVVAVVRYCREHGVPIAPRGEGHTQSGQSTTDGGVVLDTSGLRTIHAIDEDEMVADCDGGVVWRSLVEATVPQGLAPRVLTNNLGVTVAGTVSMAGLGVASFRYGSQADNVTELEVVTGTGEVVVCSREENRDLFDVVRCGLGQFGIITRAKVKLRRIAPTVRMFTVLYDDLGKVMADAERVMTSESPVYSSLGGICSPTPAGFRSIGDGLELGVGVQPYAHWMYPLYLTAEYGPDDPEPAESEYIGWLSGYKHLLTEDLSQLDFMKRMEPMFQLWRRSGYWDQPHPWMELIMPWDRAQEYIEAVLSQLPPGALGAGGHVLLWPSRTDCSDAPLLMHPEGDFVLGWGILGAVPKDLLEMGLAQLDMASELGIAYGGKRYLSGFVTFDTEERWAAHFGDRWPMVVEAKKRFDPDGILNPGFVCYPE